MIIFDHQWQHLFGAGDLNDAMRKKRHLQSISMISVAHS